MIQKVIVIVNIRTDALVVRCASSRVPVDAHILSGMAIGLSYVIRRSFWMEDEGFGHGDELRKASTKRASGISEHFSYFGEG